MAILFVATSKSLQEWGADVGLGKNLYKVGLADGQSPDEALAGFAGQSDWKVLKATETDLAEDDLLARLGRKEKLVDPNYYPKLRGAQGIVKINPATIENSLLVAMALEGRPTPKTFKLKPADVATFLTNNALK